MKKKNKIIEEIYTVRTITAFSVFCALFVALLFVMRIDDLALYIASGYVLAVSAGVCALGAFLWIFGKIKRSPLRAYTVAFVGQLVFFSALSAVLFAILVRDVSLSDAYGVLLAYGVLVVAIYTVYACSKDAFFHALATGIGIVALYVLRHFQGGARFIPLLAVFAVLSVAFAVFAFLYKKTLKTEKFAVIAATVFNIASSVVFAHGPSLFPYIVGANVVLYFITRLFVKL